MGLIEKSKIAYEVYGKKYCVNEYPQDPNTHQILYKNTMDIIYATIDYLIENEYIKEDN